jgi:hypothetical protein
MLKLGSKYTVRRIVMNARVGGDGCATLKGGTKVLAPPSLLEPGLDRISPPARASTVYHGPGFETLPEASADPYGKSSRLLVGNHRRFIAPRYRRGCPAVTSDVFRLRRDELEHTAASLDAGETHLANN